ncbi:MAG: SRPBCC domain-containing protein [Pseudomonadota bacterium]
MSDQNWVQITRDFDAPIQDIWNMWTDPELFSRWYGPNGFTVPVAEMDVTVGGTRKICMEMKAPERTMTMWFTGTYTVVSAPNRLAYTESMCDADGNVLSPSDMGMPPGTPDVTEVSIELSEADGKTRMVMTHKGVPAGSPGEGGWMQAFDKLAAQL